MIHGLFLREKFMLYFDMPIPNSAPKLEAATAPPRLPGTLEPLSVTAIHNDFQVGRLKKSCQIEYEIELFFRFSAEFKRHFVNYFIEVSHVRSPMVS
jgi:hypothetical protein